MKRLAILAVMLVVLAGVVFAGAGQEEGGAATSADFKIEAPAEESTIDIIGWTFPITDFYREEFEALNAVDNLTVNVQYLNNAGAQEQVRLALSGGKQSPYEVVHAANAQISEWGFADWLLPLDDLIDKYREEYDLDDIPETAWQAATVDGEILGIPVVSNSFIMVYREDLFDKHGIAVPKTYPEVIAAAQKLRADEPSLDIPFMINLHAGWAWEIEFLHMIRSFGGRYLNEDNTPAFTGPEGVKALEMLLEVADKAIGREGLGYSIDDVQIGLQTGRVAFANTWASRGGNMKDPEQSDYAEELQFAPSPAAVAGGRLGASAWNDFYCIPKNIDVDPDLVFRVIMEATDLESQMGAVEYGIPTRMSTLDSDKVGAYIPAAMTGLAEGVGAYPNVPALPLVKTALTEALPLSVTGDYTVQEVLDRAAANYVEEAKANGLLK